MSSSDVNDDYDPEVTQAVKRFTKLKKENERLQVELGQANMRASEFEGANKQLKINIEALKKSRDFYMSRLIEFQMHFESITNVVRAADSCLTKVSEYQQSKSELPPALMPPSPSALLSSLPSGDDDIFEKEESGVNVSAIVQKFGLDSQRQDEVAAARKKR